MLLVYSCQKKEKKEVERAFYYWKGHFNLSEKQEQFLEDLDATTLYVRYFDVGMDYFTPYPKAPLGTMKKMEGLQIIPTVYLMTEVFTNSDSSDIPRLADKVEQKIRAIHGENSWSEIQFDCDWTPSIKNRYFYFLDQMELRFPQVEVSSTIRLYQYKYPDLCGVPPVDRGVLMYYNMGELLDYEESNSILNNSIGEEYLGFNEYPLAIDIALPNFQWSLKFRQGHFQYICGDLGRKELENEQLFKQTAENRYICLRDTVLYEDYFRFGDEVRFEECSQSDLERAAQLLKPEMNQQSTRIIFYDLQDRTIHDYEKLNTIYSLFE